MLCVIVLEDSEIGARQKELWPHCRKYGKYLYCRGLVNDHDNVALASEWLDDSDEPLKGDALLQKVGDDTQADIELAVLINKGEGQALYEWMIEAGLIKIEGI